MRPSRAGTVGRSFLTGAFALTVATSGAGAGSAEEPVDTPVLSWETGEGKSYFIPALEVPGFLGAFGQPGVERALELLRLETRAIMQQVGAPTIKHLVPAMVRRT